MTALDQAFIKAFAQQSVPVVSMMPRPAAPVLERGSVRLGDPPAEEGLITPGGVLAVLEKPPKKAISPLKEEGRSEGIRPKVADEVGSGPWAVSNEQLVVGPEPWAIGSEQWAVGDEPWAADSKRSTVCLEPCCPSAEPRIATPDEAMPCSVPAPSHNKNQVQPTKLSPLDDDRPSVATPPVAPPSVATPSDGPSSTIRLYPNKPSPIQPFQPAWRVDHFTWPKICRRLIARAAEELDRLADTLTAANAQGQKVLGIAGYRRGEGATTLLLCAARRLAERGVKLALIDADLARPRLAKRLGVQPQCGWDETAVEEEGSLARAIIDSAANNLALLPLREPPNSAGSARQRSVASGSLHRNPAEPVRHGVGRHGTAGKRRAGRRRRCLGGVWNVDAVVLARDQRITSEEELIKVEGQLAVAGVMAIGIVENFAAED